ncbi:DUF1152 domain-containing protein [Streptomyces sp. NPDC048202]|uniref:DUF1152 domain-containing protein n=1 Tax=Streptomyces sp. NPDC048202 TaxID=3365514 RepID=UPI003716F8C1
MTRLIVAAGGGGDAIAAAMLSSALYGDEDPAVIFTYAWDRLLIDPLPGPRGVGDFTGLVRLTPSVWAVTPETKPIPPAGSTLPRLAAELPHTFALLDPYEGAVGITRQLQELIDHLDPESLDLLDVGGDILARGDEPTLRSPLADALTLAAASQVNASVRLLVAGPGLDGELSADELRPMLGPAAHTFTATDTSAIGAVLEWHPSEVTALLTATARGIRGTCKIRDAGLPVPLTDDGPRVHEVDLGEAMIRNTLARAITGTQTLHEANARSRRVCGFSEIDYERTKAARLTERPARGQVREAVLSCLDRFEAEARRGGVTHTTFRHITESLNLNGKQCDALRRLLITSRPEQQADPLWNIGEGYADTSSNYGVVACSSDVRPGGSTPSRRKAEV